MSDDFKRTLMRTKMRKPADATRSRGYSFGAEEKVFPQLEPGDIIENRYRVIRKVGEGSYGAVYHVFDQKMDIPKALKIFGRREESFHIIPELRDEARIMARINHPNIVRIFEFNETGEYVFLDMEYAEGGNLEEHPQAISRDDKSVIEAALQIARGLNEAHEQGIVHLDVKPSNLLLDSARNIKITDFGIAGQLALKMTSTAGTPAYMAPEHLDEKETDHRADIFSFGIVLYELVHGRYPFKLDEQGNYRYDVPHHLFEEKSDLNQIILKCIAANPEHRYRDFTRIIADLESAQQQDKAPAMGQAPGIRSFFREKMSEMGEDLRKETRTLMILLILLLLITPFYLQIVHKLSDREKPLTIEGPPLIPSVNFQSTPQLTLDNLQEGDLVQFRDLRKGGETAFEFFYGGEEPLNLRFEGNRIFLNDSLVGVHVRSRDDLPLPRNLAFIHSDIELERDDLLNQEHPNLSIRLGEAVSARTLENLPQSTRFFDLGRNERITDLRSLDRLPNLRGLDLQNAETFYPTGLNELDQIKWLNLSGNGLRSVNGLRTMQTLEHLDVSRNRLQSLAQLRRLQQLQNIQYEGNPRLPESDKKWMDEVNQRYLGERSGEVTNRRQLLWQRSSGLEKLVFGVALIVLGLIAYQLIKILGKNLPALVPAKKDKTEKRKTDSNQPLPEEFHNRLKQAEDLEKENKQWSPPEQNALRTLHELAVEYPGERQILRKEKRIVQAAERKIKRYISRSEYEPAYLNTQSVLAVMATTKLKKFRKTCLDKLIHDEPVKMIPIPAGSFVMGDFESGTLTSALPLHKVTLKGFSMSETVITNHQYCQFLNAVGKHYEPFYDWINLSSQYCRIRKSDRGKYEAVEPYSSFPVIEVSWQGAMRFCEWFGGRLPTEAEWEYAARNAGKKILFSAGNHADRSKMNYLIDKNDDRWHSVFPVKSMPPNQLGLYEMSGNVLEWCADYFDKEYYTEQEMANPAGPDKGTLRSVRGGAWCFQAKNMKTYYRGSAKPSARNNFIGFRVVKDI